MLKGGEIVWRGQLVTGGIGEEETRPEGPSPWWGTGDSSQRVSYQRGAGLPREQLEVKRQQEQQLSGIRFPERSHGKCPVPKAGREERGGVMEQVYQSPDYYVFHPLILCLVNVLVMKTSFLPAGMSHFLTSFSSEDHSSLFWIYLILLVKKNSGLILVTS